MPRRFRGSSGGELFHVINRGARRARLFHRPADYEAFLRVQREAAARIDMRLLAYVLMPNHWHMVLWPRGDHDLSRYVGWTSMTHACRWQRAHGMVGVGAVYQGRFRAIPVEPGDHLFTVLRYVERNPVRARMVDRAEDWPYSSASDIALPDRPVLHPWPVQRPDNWLAVVNEADHEAAFDELRRAVARSCPFGDGPWREVTVARLGCSPGTRGRGRPRSLPR